MCAHIIVKNFNVMIISILSVRLISVEKSSAETPQRFEDLCERGKYICIEFPLQYLKCLMLQPL